MKSIYIASAYAPPLPGLSPKHQGTHRMRIERAFDLVHLDKRFTLAHDWLTVIDTEREAMRKRGLPPRDSSCTPGQAKRHAQVDVHQAMGADVFWLLTPQEGGRGCWTEYGYVLGARDMAVAMTPPSQRAGIDQKIFVSGPATPSIFCHLADQVFVDDAQAWDYIARSGRV
jgi:hypothetical protein